MVSATAVLFILFLRWIPDCGERLQWRQLLLSRLGWLIAAKGVYVGFKGAQGNTSYFLAWFLPAAARSRQRLGTNVTLQLHTEALGLLGSTQKHPEPSNHLKLSRNLLFCSSAGRAFPAPEWRMANGECLASFFSFWSLLAKNGLK